MNFLDPLKLEINCDNEAIASLKRNETELKLMCNCSDMAGCSADISRMTIATTDEADTPDTAETRKIFTGFALGVAYAATIGGNGMVIASMSNIVLKGFFDERYPNSGFNFLTFMLFSVPVSLLMILCSWVVLSYMWLPKK